VGPGVLGVFSRVVLVCSGLLLAAPGGGMLGVNHATLVLSSAGLLVVGATTILLQRRAMGETLQFRL